MAEAEGDACDDFAVAGAPGTFSVVLAVAGVASGDTGCTVPGAAGVGPEGVALSPGWAGPDLDAALAALLVWLDEAVAATWVAASVPVCSPSEKF